MERGEEKPISSRLRSKKKLNNLDTADNTSVSENEEGNRVGDSCVPFEITKGLEYEGKHPLKNPLIVSKVFSLLKLGDLKQCRLVCSQWNELSIPFVEKMAMAIIGSPRPASAVRDRFLRSFNEIAETSMITFRSFKLKKSPIRSACWSIAALEEFFEHQDVRELTIDNMKIYRSKIYQGTLSFINRFITNNLTHLAIDNRNFYRSECIVSIDKLTSTKSLSFNHCSLDIIDNCILAPKRLEIFDVNILRQGVHVENFVVNEVLTFENLKELKLTGGTTTLSINLPSNITVENLLLDDVTCGNFHESKWCVNKTLTLRGIPFRRPTQIQFTELDFEEETINLEALPDSIEKLTLFTCDWSTHILPPMALRLPSLKYLELSTTLWFCRSCPHDPHVQVAHRLEQNEFPLFILQLFGNCGSLETVKLETKYFTTSQLLDTAWIPANVRNLFLVGRIRTAGPDFPLQKLIIQNNDMEYLFDTLDCLRSERLVLDFCSISVFNLEEIVMFLNEKSYESVAIGFLKGNMQDFENSRLPQYVDRKCSCYLFENGIGRGINEEEFKNMLMPQ